MSALPYRDFLFPLNVFMHILTSEEGDVRYLHYGLFERPDEPITEAQERSTKQLLEVLGPPPQSVLDVGIGLGTTLDRLMTLGYDAAGIAPDTNQIRVARARFPSIRVQASSFETFTPGRRYDCVVFQESAQYIAAEALFAKASELTERILVLDEFSIDSGSLPRLDAFLQTASLHGFETSRDIDLSSRAAPTIEYFMSRLPRYHDRLITELGISQAQFDAMIDSGVSYRGMYRSGGYVYRLMEFVRAKTQERQMKSSGASSTP